MAKVSVKVQYNEDIRRVSFEEKPSYNALNQLIKNLFSDTQVENFSIRYVDDESDLISVTNDREISEAWEFARANNNLLKLKITSDVTAKLPVVEPKVESKVEPKVESKVEPKVEPKVESKVEPKVENNNNSTTTTTTASQTRSVPRATTTQSQARPVTDVSSELISNFIESILDEVRKIRNVTAPEIKEILSMFNLEDLMKQFQPVLQQFTSEGYPAQIYANRSQITSNVEKDFYKHMTPLLNAFGVPDFHPKVSDFRSRRSTPTPTTTTPKPSTFTPSPCTTNSTPVAPTAAPEPLIPAPTTTDEEGTASPPYSNVYCNVCNKCISGKRYKCTDCRQYDWCSDCHPKGQFHNSSHTFTTMIYSNTTPSSTTDSTPSPVSATQMPAMSSRLIDDVTIEDGTQVEVKSQFTKVWRMKNNGNVAWGKGTRLVFVQGDLPCGETESVEVPEVEVGGEIDIALEMVAPARPGRYISNFRLEDGTGSKFGHRVWVDVVVIEAEAKKVEKVEEVKKVEEKVAQKDENAEKLDTLENMGFCDRKRNMTLLAKYKGDIVLVVNEYLY